MNPILQDWQEYLAARYAASTVRAYADELYRFSVDHPYLLEVMAGDISHFITEYGKSASPSTVRRSLSALRSFYDWALQEGLIDENPVNNLRGPKGGRRKLPRFLNDSEIETLLAAELEPRDRLLVLLMLYAGLRISEVASLEWKSIDRSAWSVRVVGKGDKERIIPLHPLIVEAITAWQQKAVLTRPGDPVFRGYRGKALNPRTMQKTIAAIGEKAGLSRHLSPHMLRHSFATRLLRGNTNVRVIQTLLGHASLSTTQIYTHVTDTDLQMAIKGL